MNQPTITQPIPSAPTRQFQIKIEEHSASNPPSFKRKFPSILPPINTEYIVETHYQASSFQNNFELLKKVIIDLAGDKEENCEYDIIVKKRKLKADDRVHSVHPMPETTGRFASFQPNEEKPLISQQSPVEKSANVPKDDDDEDYEASEKEDSSTTDHPGKLDREASKHRHKNCPKLFGRAFFNMVLNNKEFQNKYLQKAAFSKKIREIDYPPNAELNLQDFFSWIRKERFNEKYTNLRVFRDIWSWKIDSDKNWQEKHFKYYLSYLMKIFFEQYAYTYIIKSNIQHENGKDYINFIPKFLNGIDNPESFNSLKN